MGVGMALLTAVHKEDDDVNCADVVAAGGGGGGGSAAAAMRLRGVKGTVATVEEVRIDVEPWRVS